MSLTPRALPRPPYDGDVARALERLVADGVRLSMGRADIETVRAAAAPAPTTAADVLGFEEREVWVPGYGGDEIRLAIFSPRGAASTTTCLFQIHGGGMVSGSRYDGMDAMLRFAQELDATVVSVEYRLAPEHQDPVPVEDCYAALVWVESHRSDLNIGDRLVVAGGSAGGGLAAGIALLARDRKGPTLDGLFLMCPMLDDRDATVSTHQFDGVGIWDRTSNQTGWSALLGDRIGSDDVSIYAAPSRAQYLGGLPPTYLDVGSAEVFRDEDVAFVSQIWADGGDAELHVWPGGTHGWEILASEGSMAVGADQIRRRWLSRLRESWTAL